jgi:hypothetical protein
MNVTDKYLVVYRNIRLTFPVMAPAVGMSGQTIQNLIYKHSTIQHKAEFERRPLSKASESKGGLPKLFQANFRTEGERRHRLLGKHC